MPTYDYECRGCGHQFEELQSFSEPVLTKCPACKKNKLERLFGGGGAIIFKGSGFYETDYRRAGSGAKKSESESNGTSETKGETKTEASTATPSPSDSSSASGSSGSAGQSNGKGGGKKAK